MEAIIDFLKNGVVIIFYGILLSFGVFTLHGILRGALESIFRKIFKFKEED